MILSKKGRNSSGLLVAIILRTFRASPRVCYSTWYTKKFGKSCKKRSPTICYSHLPKSFTCQNFSPRVQFSARLIPSPNHCWYSCSAMSGRQNDYAFDHIHAIPMTDRRNLSDVTLSTSTILLDEHN